MKGELIQQKLKLQNVKNIVEETQSAINIHDKEIKTCKVKYER